MHTLEPQLTPVKPRARASYVPREITVPDIAPVEIIHPPIHYVSRPTPVIKPHGLAVKASRTPKKTVTNPKQSTAPRKKLALLLPGHNEELIIATTIRSAMAAGQKKRDIFVVDDASTDATRRLAVELLGKQNVLSVRRSGKALAVKKAIKKFNIEHEYQWLHVADADSIFSPDYFRIYRRKLDVRKFAVAVGFVQSLRGNWISTYRALTYTFSQHVNRRIQSKLGMISVFPGPITCFRTDILKHLDFEAESMTEDFDITLQVHRKRLGKIVFIPKAINYTQDPQTLRDFCKQTQRWQRGFFQGVRKYRIGLHRQRIDVSLGFQMMQTILFLIQLSILFPLIIITTNNWKIIPVAIAADFILNSAIAIWASVVSKRWMLLGALPYFYFLRWVEIIIYLSAFFEVIVFQRFKTNVKGWATEGRRYKLDTAALQDVAH
jgi:cellulose synthase/poly-beta-1,6-N-acetylglucosamine synthase-like glycosyltransferase